MEEEHPKDRKYTEGIDPKNHKYTSLTSMIIRCAMNVHCELGNGFPEFIYQRALAIELAEAGIPFEREFTTEVYYKGHYVGSRRVDFLVDKLISVELKARMMLEHGHFAQAKNYLEAYKLEVGLLINFGAPSLEFKRITNKKK